MADTAVAITAGTGTNIDTRTESTNSNHRQVIVIGDPTANNSVAAVMAASTAPVATDPALVVSISPNTQNANGSTTDANSTPVAWSTEGKAQVGSLTETAPASDTASSGLNGRLQRVAQRLTSMLAVLPAALGQTTMAASTPVAIASNQSTLPAGLVPVTSGGLTPSSTLIAAGTNATSVKASAGQLYKIEITNNSANIGYLKIYNTAGTPTAGAGTPVIRLMCPASASGAGAVSSFDNGVAFATGIGFTFTGGIADADTTSVAASAFIANLYYK